MKRQLLWVLLCIACLIAMLAKALRVVAYRECEDIQESVTSDEGGVIITKQPCGECPPCEAAATLAQFVDDRGEAPDHREKKP